MTPWELVWGIGVLLPFLGMFQIVLYEDGESPLVLAALGCVMMWLSWVM